MYICRFIFVSMFICLFLFICKNINRSRERFMIYGRMFQNVEIDWDICGEICLDIYAEK